MVATPTGDSGEASHGVDGQEGVCNDEGMSLDNKFLDSLSSSERDLVVTLGARMLPEHVEIPNRKHRCRATINGVNVDRCGCGAVRLKTRAYWVWRNTR